MTNLFKAEWLRFRWVALAVFLLHTGVLAFLNRLADMAQQPLLVYQVFAMVYFAVASLLGAYQMGLYRRPNHWLGLLHRPLHRLRILGALGGASSLAIAVMAALPIACIVLYQATATARVVDVRHWMMPLAAWLIALSGYGCGAFALVANRRYSAAIFALPVLLMFAKAHGAGMLAVQATLALVIAALLALAFKPDATALPRQPAGAAALALPVMLAAYFALWVAGYAYELAWSASGGHPLSLPAPPRGGVIEAERADGKALLLMGLADSRHADAPLWREQVALADAYQRSPRRNLPLQGEMGNIAPMEFVDGEHGVIWVFSHDRMRFVGRGLLDQKPRGTLGLGDAQAAFTAPVLPEGAVLLLDAHAAYQSDDTQQRIYERVRMPDGEVMAATPQPAGDFAVALSNRAAYFYPGREMADTLERLTPQLTLPLPQPVGRLSRMDWIALLDGHLISLLYTWGTWSGDLQQPVQIVLRQDSQGHVEEVARRALVADMPEAYRSRTAWLSPALRALCLHAQNLYAAPDALRAEPDPLPANMRWLALACMLVAAGGAALLGGRLALSRRARWAWVALCAAFGLPALVALLLMVPRREADLAPAPSAAKAVWA